MREDWIECELDTIASKITKGSTPTTYGYKFQTSGINFVKIENVKNGIINTSGMVNFISKEAHDSQERSKLKEGDILFSIAGTIGETCLVKEEVLPANTSQAFAIISGFSECLMPGFLRLQFESFVVSKVKSKARGGAMNNVSLGDLRALITIIPPLPEQRAIVAKIEELFSSLDSGIADLKKAQAQLITYRHSVLKSAFEGNLTKDWRTNNPYKMDAFLSKLLKEKEQAIKSKNISNGQYFPKFKDDELTYKVPNNWLSLPWKTLTCNNKYALKRGPFGSALKKSFFVDKGIVVYEQGHAINDDPYRHRYFITNEKFEELKAFKTQSGDMIVSCSGATLGRICLLPDDADVGIINQALLKIDLDEKIILKKFFVMLFRSETFQRLIFTKSLGSAMPNMVGMAELKEIPIPIPSIEEQHQIVLEIESRLSICDKVEESLVESLEKSKALRQSILKKAFEGRLLNKQELAACKSAPDYEPASVLLKRIKAEKLSKK